MEKYKGVGICLAVLKNALSGSYVNFGVFALYGDTALSDALRMTLQMALTIPLSELMAYPKAYRAYFGFIEVLCHNHMNFIADLDTSIFVQIIESVYEGMRCSDVPVSSQCATALNHIVDFQFRSSKKDCIAVQKLNGHIHANPDLFPKFLGMLFNMIMFEECANQWSLSRPMLSLILTNEEVFNQLKHSITTSQRPDRQHRLLDAFDKLMQDVQRNLEPKNRDKFTQNLTYFRHEVKTFIA